MINERQEIPRPGAPPCPAADTLYLGLPVPHTPSVHFLLVASVHRSPLGNGGSHDLFPPLLQPGIQPRCPPALGSTRPTAGLPQKSCDDQAFCYIFHKRVNFSQTRLWKRG